MSMFKSKNKKPFVGDNRVTLDAKHNDMLRQFKDQRKSLPEKQKELSDFQSKYNDLKKIPTKNLTNEQLNNRFALADSISKLEKEIDKIENGHDEYDYFLETGHLLYKYYDNIENIASSKNKHSSSDEDDGDFIISESPKKVTTSITDFFSSQSKQNLHQENKNSQPKNGNNIKKPKKMDDFVTTKENFQRADILDNYLKIVDPTYVGNLKFDNKYDKCDDCGCEKILLQEEGKMVCEQCGKTDLIVIDSDRPSYKDPPPKDFGCKSSQLLSCGMIVDKPVIFPLFKKIQINIKNNYKNIYNIFAYIIT